MEYSKDNASNAVIHEFTAIDVKDLRAKVSMTQNEFASAFGISVVTLCHWERGGSHTSRGRTGFIKCCCEKATGGFESVASLIEKDK